jgi:hypothetical protein
MLLLLLVAVVSWFVWKSGNRLQDEIRNDANARIAEANAEAAKAIEGLAKSNEEVARLKQESLETQFNLEKTKTSLLEAKGNVLDLQIAAADAKAAQQRVEIDLATATAEAGAKQTELAKEQGKLAEEQRKTAEAQREAAEAQLALKKHLEEVAERTNPRHLTYEQIDFLVELFKANPKGQISVTCINGNKESCDLATEIAGALRVGGWEVSGPADMVLFGPSGNTPTGLFITVQNRTPPKRAGILQQALQRVGLLAPAQVRPRRLRLSCRQTRLIYW